MFSRWLLTNSYLLDALEKILIWAENFGFWRARVDVQKSEQDDEDDRKDSKKSRRNLHLKTLNFVFFMIFTRALFFPTCETFDCILDSAVPEKNVKSGMFQAVLENYLLVHFHKLETQWNLVSKSFSDETQSYFLPKLCNHGTMIDTHKKRGITCARGQPTKKNTKQRNSETNG